MKELAPWTGFESLKKELDRFFATPRLAAAPATASRASGRGRGGGGFQERGAGGDAARGTGGQGQHRSSSSRAGARATVLGAVELAAIRTGRPRAHRRRSGVAVESPGALVEGRSSRG